MSTEFQSQHSERVAVSTETLFAALDALRRAPIYALLHVAPDELAEDFKPHKWEGFEREFAEESIAAYRGLLREMGATMGVPVDTPAMGSFQPSEEDR